MSPLAAVSVLRREPDLDGLPPMVPAPVGQVLRVSTPRSPARVVAHYGVE
jgi:hypothetical protein